MTMTRGVQSYVHTPKDGISFDMESKYRYITFHEMMSSSSMMMMLSIVKSQWYIDAIIFDRHNDGYVPHIVVVPCSEGRS